MKRLVALMPALALLTPIACNKLQWKEFSSPEGRFSVILPGTPKAETRAQGGLTAKAYAVEVKNAAYLVSYTDLRPGTPFDFSAGIQAMAANYKGKVLSETDFILEGSKGKTFEMEINQPKGFASGRMAVVNDRLYQLLALGANLRSTDADVQKFFDSFKLTK